MREWIDEPPRAGDDRAAFAEAVEHFAPRVRDFLSRTGASESAVEDATQAVMTALWRDGTAASDPIGGDTAGRVFALSAKCRDALLGGAVPVGPLDPAVAFAPSERNDAPMPSLAAVEARLQRIQDQLRRARVRQGRGRAA